MIRGIHHVAINTANFDVMVRFYQDAFGFEPAGEQISWKDSPMVDSIVGVKNSAARVMMLKAGTCFIEIFEYATPKARGGGPLHPNDHGYTHFCVDVTDIEHEYTRLKNLGMTFANPTPVDAGNHKTVYGKDPDGNVIEIQEVKRTDDMFALENISGQTPRTTRA